MKKKKAFTLLEIMIVIFLIGLIGSVIGYNMKGSLDQGKAFKTEQAALKIADLLELEIAKGGDFSEGEEELLRRSGVVKNPKKLLKDGWGVPFDVDYDNNEIIVHSQALEDYRAKKGIAQDDDEG